ncbi:hypothetical protein P775_20840 [Puniceibacterium antarcticum]|uniref:Uncharacterized protein n=1 Tax=Puniceibacterium antarcticum TaxID=1206336 RepID=A0A2G8RAP7_9RHOB|nr:hypothetical protein [Puniceibacterium antarcticum]PIL18208.1 hypothetical protein P775_20840 [Puniceibacterium antarcticum]
MDRSRIRCGDTREEERCRRDFDRPREEERAAELWWEWAPNGPIPKLRCGDTREEERCRRDFDRPREEERAAELWWE